MNRRIFKEDGSLVEKTSGSGLNPSPGQMTGWGLRQQFADLIRSFVLVAEKEGFDLRDLAAMMHGGIEEPISRAILNRRRRAEGVKEIPI